MYDLLDHLDCPVDSLTRIPHRNSDSSVARHMVLQAAKPKQYLELGGQPIAMYSLHAFASMPEVFELVIVCNSEYRYLLLLFI